MRNSILSFILILFFINGIAQNPFNLTYGNTSDDEYATGIIYDNNRYIITISDYTVNTGPIALFLNSNLGVYNQLQDNAYEAWCYKYMNYSLNSFVSTGGYSIISTGKQDVLLQIVTDTSTILIKHFGGIDSEFGRDLVILPDSGFLIAGTKINSNNKVFIYLVRTDKNGDSMWTKTIGDSYGQEAYGIEKLNDSTYIISGTWGNVLNGSADAFAMKINLQGDTSNLRLYGNAYQNFGQSLCKTSDDGYAIAGWSTYDFVVHEQMVLYKLDSNLNLLWTKYYGDLYTDEALDIKQTYDKGFILVGYSQQVGRGDDVYIVRTDSIGDTLWTKTLGGLNDERAYSVVQTSDSGFAIVGYTYSYGAGGSDAFFLKLKPNGDITTSIGLPVEPKKEEIQVYPNPAINSISIELAQNTDVSSIRIADNLGKIVKEIRINRTIQSEIIPIDDLSDGIYFIQIQTNDGSILSKKFVKQKD